MPPTEQPAKTINEVLAENLRHFMREKGVTQAALAKAADMGQTTISLYLSPDRREIGATGKERSAKLAEVNRLAAALQVELWELLRPLTPAQREFYRGVDALLQRPELGAAAQASSRKRPPPRAA